MAITADVRKFGDTLVAQGRVTITETTKPLYAVVGANDLAVEKLRELPTQLQARLTELQSEGKKLQGKLQERVVALPQDYKNLPTQVKTYAETVQDRASTLYTELTERGEKLVGQIRRQPSTKAAKAQGKQAVRSTKATKTSTTKAAKTAAEATGDAASKVG